MRFSFFSLTLALLALPFGASAQMMPSWDFRGKVPDGWQLQGVVGSQASADGLHLKIGPQGGGILHTATFPTLADSATIHVRSVRDTKAYLLWHVHGTPEDAIPQLPYALAASTSSKTIQLPLNYYRPQWNEDVESVGIFFDPDSEVIIERISFQHYGISEKAIELLKGLWTFDEFRPYSINFLWGPLVSYTPAMRATLYESLPPLAHSMTQWMYAALGVCLAAWVVTRALRPAHAATAFGLLCAMFAVLWIGFDIRMGAEITSYALGDLQSFTFAPEGARKLRTHQGIFDTLDEAMPELQKHERFGLVTVEAAFYSLIRYRSYPTLPMTPDMSQSGITLWLVGYRDDAHIDAQHRLVVADRVLSGSGRIVRQFDSQSYLFSTAP